MVSLIDLRCSPFVPTDYYNMSKFCFLQEKELSKYGILDKYFIGEDKKEMAIS